ncbi:MAG: biotin--[acetyl-CoA-carboxylase] ligase [Hungatella sp.]
MKTEILKLLKGQDGYLSGQDLCDHLGVSRTAVWKIIKQLQKEGYRIEAVRSKGYHLVETADVMTEAELQSCMEAGWIGRVLQYYDEIDSTNTKAKQLAETGAPAGMLIVADSQLSGRGRRGRNWLSPHGTGIFLSLLLRPQIAPSCASMLTLVAALAVTKGIEEVTGLDAKIKWPNDIVMDGKKLCGILTEMSAELDDIHYVVIGIGMNVNHEEFEGELVKTATSLLLQAKRPVKRSLLIAAIMKAFAWYYDQFIKTEDLSLLLEEYETKLVNKEREVMVLKPSESYRGTCKGINQLGELLVQHEDETVEAVVSGEVSVRGIYGYV